MSFSHVALVRFLSVFFFGEFGFLVLEVKFTPKLIANNQNLKLCATSIKKRRVTVYSKVGTRASCDRIYELLICPIFGNDIISLNLPRAL